MSDLDTLLGTRTYAVPDERFDELRAAPGRLRPHWAAFGAHAGDLGPAQLSRAQARVARQIHENGVTFNVYAEPGAPARPWALDVLPHLVPAADWERLADGLRQRARLLDAMAADLYGDQRLLAEGLVPPALVFGHCGFLPACHGVRPPGGIFLHLIAFDVARGRDGRWHVAHTRCQAPSGAGYALENRLTISRLFPDAFRDLHVARLAPFFRTLQETVIEGAPHGGATPHIVLLTPGPYNETYFEHAYLARYLGFTLVEGGDLAVRDDRVFLKTVTGLEPVHGIVRRLDDDFCDPLELRPDSTLGVPGLVQAWRAGRVLIANAFGTSLLESPALAPLLPAVCARLLGEHLRHPLPEHDPQPGGTKGPLNGGSPRPPTPGGVKGLKGLPSASDDAEPDEALALSHTPVWHEGRLESRALMLRAFVVSDGRGDYRVLPGGLSRIAGAGRATVSTQRGGSSKDTWVLSEAPVERVTLLRDRLRMPDIARSERLVSSRTGENLFWLGRYAERSENSARLLRAVLTRLPQGDALDADWSGPIVATCVRHGLLPAEMSEVGAGSAELHTLERALIDGLAATEGEEPALQGLAFNVEQTVRVAGAVRERLSSDNWRVLHQLSQTFARLPSSSSSGPSLAETLERLDGAILSLVAVGGLEMAHMTRDDGWRFLSLGRHLERLLYVATTVGAVAARDAHEEPALLEWLLDLSDSIITYRARYMSHPEWLAVAALLLFDGRNPRSAAFQLSKLAKHVRLLPEANLGDLVAGIERTCDAYVVAAASAGAGQGDLFPRGDEMTTFLKSCEQFALRLSDALTLRYFSHVYEPAHATALL